MTTPPIPDMENAETPAEEPKTPFQMLSTAGKNALEGMLTSALKSDQVGRREEVRFAWKLRNYCRGLQNGIYDKRSFIYVTPEASGEELPPHMAVFDITSPHKKSLVANLSESSPGINFVPNDLQKGEDVSAAKLGEKLRAKVDRLVQMADRQQEVAGFFCTDGRTVSWPRIVDGALEFGLYGVLESKVPLYSRDVKDWGYCVLSWESDIWKAKFENPDYADEISEADTVGESQYERYARLAIISKSRGGNTESLKGLVTEHYAWIKPWRYLKLNDTVREEIEKAFPSGVRMHAYGKTVVDAVEETMDCLNVEFPVDGRGQVRPPLLNGMPDIQDAYNDLKNLLKEMTEYGVPATWVNTDGGIDIEAIAEQRAQPGAVHGVAAGSRSMAEMIFQETAIEIAQSLMALLESYKVDAEFVTSDFPAQYGGDTPGQDTVGVNKLLANQAKGLLGPAWSGIQRLWAKSYPILIKLVPQIGAVDEVDQGDLAALFEGNFSCHPDKDSSFPETTADKRASLQAVLGQLGQGDQGQAIVYQPDNLKLIKQYSGLKDLVIPGAEARDKQLREIDLMLEESPVPPSPEEMQQWDLASQQAQAAGQPPPPQPQDKPTVDIDEDWDFHQPEMDKGQEWLSSDACAEAMRGGKQAGVENIKLHLSLHRAAIAKAAQAATPAPVPPKVSLTAAITDPTTIAQFAQAAGATTSTPQGIAESQVPDQQEQAASTQHKAAQARHISVLAAKEAVEPAGGFAHNNPPPAPSKAKGE